MIALYIVFGIIGGILGGMGMGGGTLLIPLLTLGLNVSQQTAQLLNLVSFIPMSLLALMVHVKNKLLVRKGLFFIIIPALLSAIGGSYLATVTDTEILKKYFGGFLVLLGTVYLISLIVNACKSKQ